MEFGLKEFPSSFDGYLVHHNGSYKPKNRKLELILKTYLSCYVKFIGNVHDENMLVYIFTASKLVLRSMLAFQKVFKKFIRLVAKHFGESLDINLKLRCFLVLKELGELGSQNVLDIILKVKYCQYCLANVLVIYQ